MEEPSNGKVIAEAGKLLLNLNRNGKHGWVTMDIAALESAYLDGNGEFNPNADLDRQYLAPALAQLFQLTEKEGG